MRTILFNSRGLRAGWRLLIFVAIFLMLSFLASLFVEKIVHLRQRPFLDPISFCYDEIQALILVLIATWVMSRIERRHFAAYGIPSIRRSFGRDFWIGIVWGIASSSAVIGLIAVLGGYRVRGFAIHGATLWYFTVLWTLANLLIGFAEEFQFRAYLLATTADGLGFWTAAILLSTGFGALHFFFKPHERWEDFASTGLLGLFMCFTLRRTGSLAFAIGFHAAFDFANLFVFSGSNAGEFAIGHLLGTTWQGPNWLTGGLLGPEASWMVFPVIAAMFTLFSRIYTTAKFPPPDEDVTMHGCGNHEKQKRSTKGDKTKGETRAGLLALALGSLATV